MPLIVLHYQRGHPGSRHTLRTQKALKGGKKAAADPTGNEHEHRIMKVNWNIKINKINKEHELFQ